MRYRRVHESIWSRPWFAALPHDARNFYIWSLTCRHHDRAGIIAVLDGVVQAEVGVSAARLAAMIPMLTPYVLAPVPCIYVVDGWTMLDLDNPNMAAAAIEVVMEHEPAVRAAWLAANEADFGRRGYPGCDEVRASLEGVELPAPLPPPAPRATREDPLAPAVAELFAYWQTVAGRQDATLTRHRNKAIRAALRSGCNVERLRLSIEGQRKSTFHMGDNKDREVLDDIVFAMRATNVERFVRLANGKATAPTQPKRVKSILFPEWNDPEPEEPQHESP